MFNWVIELVALILCFVYAEMWLLFSGYIRLVYEITLG